MAPSYAKIFMDRLENSLPDGYHKKPHTWLRYIDEICMIWTEGEEQLKVLSSYFNSAHDTIKFTWDWSHKSVNHLDVTIISDHGNFTTDLFVKPTDKHQYLDFHSCHPPGRKRSIPYSQALRLPRICSSDELFDQRATELTGFLCTRGYKGGLLSSKSRERNGYQGKNC